jgi:hypothetical protein
VASRGRVAADQGPALDEVNPWPGLVAFSERAQRFFFGREVELDDLFRRVRRETLTVLYAQSGLGKTSLLQAGLFPKLRREGFLPVPIRLDYGEAEHGGRADADPPGRQIALAIAKAIDDRGLTEASDPLAAAGPWEFLHDVDFAIPDETGSPLTPVLVFDQFEELFTLGAGRRDLGRFAGHVAELLGDLIENRAPQGLERALKDTPGLVDRYDFARANYRVLLSLREEYLPHLHGLRTEAPSIILNNARLTRFNRHQALEVVERPAATRNLVTRTVAEAIIQTVAGREALGDTGTHRALDQRKADAISKERPGQQLEVDPALLSLFCRELNTLRLARKDPAISLDLVATNRETVLRDFYLDCFKGLSPPPEPGVKAFVEDFLLTSKGYRDRLTLERATEILVEEYHGKAAELQTLVDRRLLQIEERGKTPQIELTHDVLAPIALRERAERERNEELRRVEQEATAARLRARRYRRRAIIVGTGLTLGLIGAAVAASTFLKQATNLEIAKGISDEARQRADRSAFRAESLLAVSQAQTAELEERNRREARLAREALLARDRARDAAATARREEQRSAALLTNSCDQTLALLGLMADSAADHPEMAGVYRNFLSASEENISQLRRQDTSALCPIKLEARVRTIQVGTLRDQRDSLAAFRKAAEALPAVQRVARHTDSDSRWLASVLYLELASQLYIVDTAKDRALAERTAREGIAVARLVDPAKDLTARNRLARLHHYRSLSLFYAKRWEEARAAAESGLSVVREGKGRAGQDLPHLLYTESQIHIRLAEIDSAIGRPAEGAVHYVEATRAAAGRSEYLKTTVAERWLARIYEWRGMYSYRLGDRLAARRAYDSSAILQKKIFDRRRDEGAPAAQVTATGDTLIRLQRNIADLELLLGDTASAVVHFRENVATAVVMTQVQPNLRTRRNLSLMYDRLGDALRNARQHLGADSAYREQLSLDSLFAAAEGPTQSNLDNLAYSFGKMGQISWTRDRFADARYYTRQQVALRRDIYTRPTPGRRAAQADSLRAGLATALGSLSWRELFGGSPDSAASYAVQAFALDSTQDYTLPNRANGLLLAGRIPELETLLQSYGNRRVETRPSIEFPCAVVRDTRVLSTKGFATPEQLATMERLVASRCPASNRR